MSVVKVSMQRITADRKFAGDVIQGGAGDAHCLNASAVRMRANRARRTSAAMKTASCDQWGLQGGPAVLLLFSGRPRRRASVATKGIHRNGHQAPWRIAAINWCRFVHIYAKSRDTGKGLCASSRRCPEWPERPPTKRRRED
jgi:hypothetical protein